MRKIVLVIKDKGENVIIMFSAFLNKILFSEQFSNDVNKCVVIVCSSLFLICSEVMFNGFFI